MRRSVLRSRRPLRQHRRPSLSPEDLAARSAWKEPHAGFCQCGCNRFNMHLERHHVVYQQHVRADHGNEWDIHNSMLLDPRCHAAHHSGQRRIKLERIPVDALAFAVDLFGELRAAEYVLRYYNGGALS